MTDKMKHNILGLTTKEALAKLHNDVQEMLEKFHASQNFRWQYIKDSLHHSNNHSLLCWTSAVVLFVNGFLLLAVSTFYDEPLYGNLWLQGIIIIVLVICNLIAVIWDTKLRYGEITNRVLEILNYVKQSESICRWHPENYPHLCTPYSPCITLQWTYRDGNLVNLPWALLVAGDTILIRPGQPAPAYCIPFNEKNCPELLGGEVYSPPPTATAHDTFTTPAARIPLENKHYKLMETPFLKNLRAALDESTSRPVTFHNRQRHILMIACIEQLALPVVLACILCINTLRYVYVTSWVGAGSWVEMLVLAPVSLTLPLLPLIFPVAWICLYSYGTARLTALLHSTSSLKNVEDPFDDTDLGEKKPPVLDLTWKQVKPLFFNILFGHQHDLSRSANILHVLGSVTALCCVDKKGILSWPNPTAEKVFFLRNAQDISPALSETSLIDQHSDVVGLGLGDVTDVSTSDICNTQHDRQLQQQRNHHQHSHHHHFHHHSNPTTNLCQPRDMNSQMTVAEVLDLTHDHSCPFRLEFDDPSWKQFLPSLKPLGLAILLNTCNMATQDHYTQFCSHVTCEALYNEDLVPVTNRRCLCELAKQIGFADSAQHIFTLEQQLSTFRHVQPETVRRDIKFARSLALATKLKFPFPHMVAVVVKERANRGAMQLFSQGTADIVLDACVEYWNGKELCTLSPLDRKKVQDFYQRTSLTAYCTAFAYRPLSHSVGNNLSKVYMELPADSAHLYIPNRSPTPLTWSSGILGHFQSTDSLLGSEQHDNEVTDIDGCFQIQCNQVFVGMVTMQYQAQIDMVQLIEQLERACVRFVHFSKENELRSRVFSEKMGLESGWNCHISLLSERNSATAESVKVIPTPTKQQLSMNRDDLLEPLLNSNNSGTLSSSRQISMSAPSAINLDPPPDKGRAEQEARQGDKVDDEVNVTISVADINDGWQSLSCLTDSTEQSAPVNFDMSNRAKLPRGIDKIRPHLELVDNVPLLVSLFTDCTPSTTREMITIMQDYGEVVCVLGSSANADNIGLFLKANASIAVQPQFPQVCQKISVYKETRPDCGPSPVKISQQLNSLPCSISLLREDCGSIFHLIMEARHFMLCAWNCVQYWACCIVTLSAVQLAAALMLLPPLFTTGQVLWLTALIIPMLSLSLVGVPTDPQVMQRATGKNHCAMNADLAMFVLWCYGSKFLLTIFITPLVFAASLSTLCSQIVSKLSDDDHSQCGLIYPAPDTSHSWGGWTRYPFALSSAQQSAALLLVVHYITVSMSFVHREYLTWRRGPHINHMWLTVAFITYGTEERNHAVVAAVGCEVGSSTQRGTRTCVFMVIWCWESLSDNPVAPWRYIFCIIGLRLSLQICYTFVVLWWERQELEQPPSIFDLPWPLVVAVIVSPVLVFCINEFVKWQEIKANVRYQKRARLEFGTKLGMNSPF